MFHTLKFFVFKCSKRYFNQRNCSLELSLNNNAELVYRTLEKLFKLPLTKNCLIHTDQGSTYTREKYIQKLESHGIRVSMSRRGNCWNNAPIESFFSHLKSEELYLNELSNMETTIEIVKNYIDFCNNERIQKN